MELTIDLVKAVEDIGSYSRSMLKAEAAERIANAFGYTLEQLHITPEQVEQGVDWGRRLETYNAGAAVATFHLARRIADELNPKWDEGLGSCPYSGAGKSADWATSTALKAIKQAIDFPQLYVTGKYGPNKRHPENSNWSILGSGELLGYELWEYDDTGYRAALQTFLISPGQDAEQTERKAYDALVYLANEEEGR